MIHIESGNADHLISVDGISVNCMGYAFYKAGLTSRKGDIIPRELEGFEELEEVASEGATFVAVVSGPEKMICHIGYIDPRDKRYVYHTSPYETPRRQTIKDAMNLALNSGVQNNPAVKRELVYLGIKSNNPSL